MILRRFPALVIGLCLAAPAIAGEVARDLPAAIEKRHGALASRGSRALAGNSMGGFGAVGIALAYPERFAVAASMSGAFWMTLDEDKPLDSDTQARVARVFEGAFGAPFARPVFLKHSPHALEMGYPAGLEKPAVYLRFGGGGPLRADRTVAHPAARADGKAIRRRLRNASRRPRMGHVGALAPPRAGIHRATLGAITATGGASTFAVGGGFTPVFHGAFLT